MATGVNNCYFVDPDIVNPPVYEGQCDQESIPKGLVFMAANEAGIEGGKRKQEEEHFVKTPKRLRLDSICHSYTPTQHRTASLCCNPNATRPDTVLSPSNPTSPPTSSLALFRKSSRPPAKKYTRPPTKKVFESLKLSPEEWVRLEGEAKAYMLNTAHPERQACVGNRANGPTNDTKINLYKTVQRFLESDIGERFFSQEKDAGERWVHPRDETALISLLTPLMRRMVTNERQRQYARRTRAALQQQQQAQSRNQSPSQHDVNNDILVQSVDQFAEQEPSQRLMEVFYLSSEKRLYHQHAIEDVSLDYRKLHECILAEHSHHRSADSLQSLKIYVHGPYKLEVVDENNWNTIREDIRSAAWTAEGPIKIVVRCE